LNVDFSQNFNDVDVEEETPEEGTHGNKRKQRPERSKRALSRRLVAQTWPFFSRDELS